MQEFLTIGLIGTALMLLTSAVVYETLAVLWERLPRMRVGRRRIAVVIGAIFIAHIVCIWIYGVAFYWLMHHLDVGGFEGASIADGNYGTDLFSMVYYSTVTYTSLGYGDIVPTRGFRFLAGIEVLNGLVLIGWTVSYAFIAMQKFWKFSDAASLSHEQSHR